MDANARLSYNKIADYIILFFQEHGEPLTNLKLQKLLYYSQGWYLALYDVPLFEDRIEAWVHGPVVPSAYHAFKQYGYGLITEQPSSPNLAPKISNHLNEIIDVYGSYSAFELEDLTHQTDPWKIARGNLPIDQSSDAEISQNEMKLYFKMKMTQDEQK